MPKPTLYISGAISGIPDLNRPKFSNATKKLRGLGYIVINPHEICDGISAVDWDKCMRVCIRRLVDADILVLLDDWQQSRGAQIEFTLAKQIGIETISFQNFTDRQTEYENED